MSGPSSTRLNDLIYYAKTNDIDIICLQEPVPSITKNKKAVPKISGYHHYQCTLGNGLLTYIKRDIPHCLVKTSNDKNSQYQVFSININGDALYICNTYIAPCQFNPKMLPPTRRGGIIYMGDFNARHTNFGDDRNNRNGGLLSTFVQDNHLQVYPTDVQTHILGGRLDYSMGFGVAHSNVKTKLVDELISDHFAVITEYCVTEINIANHPRQKIDIPSFYTEHFLQLAAEWYETYTPVTVTAFYRDLVEFIKQYHEKYVLWWRNRKIKKKGQNGQEMKHLPNWVEDPRLEPLRDNVLQLAQTYKNNKTPDNLHAFLTATRTFREYKDSIRNKHWEQFLQGINAHTSPGEIWRKIRKLTGKNTSHPLHHSPKDYANSLLKQYTETSKFSSLPQNIQHYFNETKLDRQFKIEIACSELDETDRYPVTEQELNTALSKGKSTSPGDDGITYDTLRLLARVKGNPLLTLYQMSLTASTLPPEWTESTIIPIPKPKSDKYRPISLTSCFCKVLERIVLGRLMYKIHDKLSPYLFGYLQGKSTQHCFSEYFSHTNKDTHTAFIDLKAAFDIANREIILEELASLGVSGGLLRWIAGYLSNRKARVCFKGIMSSTKETFELGTPQGGVLSPTLFNVLMNKLVCSLDIRDGEAVICYADDICIKAQSPDRLQGLLDQFAESSLKCGFVISVDKTKVLIEKNNYNSPSHNPNPIAFHIDNTELNHCTSYPYLGIQTDVVRNCKKYVKDLKDRLTDRLKPLKTLVGKTVGINVNIARTFYLLYIRSLIDYNALHLASLSDSLLDTLETVQNTAMRLILGCPMSTRIVNMRLELKLPTLTERIKSVATMFGVKCVKQPSNSPKFSNDLTQALSTPDDGVRGRNNCFWKWFRTTYLTIKQLNIPIVKDEPGPVICPWDNIHISIHYTKGTKKDHTTTFLKQIVLETIDTIKAQLPPNSKIAYSDGSLQSCGRAGSACEIYAEHLCIFNASYRLQNWASTTQSELVGIHTAVEYLVANECHGLIISDSKSALASLNSSGPECSQIVNKIKLHLITARRKQLNIQLLWVPSHIGLSKHDRVDKLANDACLRTTIDVNLGMSNTSIKNMLVRETYNDLLQLRNSERPASISIKHYDQFCDTQHMYGMHKNNTRHCDIVTARIRLGYRYIWQVSNKEPTNEFSSCKVCSEPLKHTLEHYITECPEIADFRPPGMLYHDLCNFLTETNVLEDILYLYPGFASP